MTADFLSEYYLKLNQTYYGDDVISDPEIADEWSRIPHFYYNYYVYQYATGFAAANTLASRILSGDEAKRNDYLNYLKSGSSDYPIEVMKRAGVDMTQVPTSIKHLQPSRNGWINLAHWSMRTTSVIEAKKIP